MIRLCWLALMVALSPVSLLCQHYPDRAAHQESLSTLPDSPWNPRAVPSDASGSGGKAPKDAAVYAPELSVPPEAHASYLAGMQYLRDQKPHEAEGAFRKAVELFPKYSSAFNGLGVALRDEKRLPEARTAFDQSLQLNPANSYAQKNLASLFLSTGTFGEAEQLLLTATKLTPHEPEPLLMLAYVELTLKHYDAALATTDGIDRKDRSHFPVRLMIRASALECTGHLKEAAREYEAYLKTAPDEAHAALARAALQRLQSRSN